VSRAQERLIGLQAQSRTGSGLVSSGQLAGEFIDDLDARRDRAAGLRIGLDNFDSLTNGLEPGDLVVVAGRPGMGKTALLVTIAEHVAREHSTAVFSAEMPARQLMRRCLSLVGNIPQGRFRRADLLTDEDWGVISPAAARIGNLRLWIDDTALPTLEHVRGECVALKAKGGLGLVLVDYVQLVKGSGKNRYEELRDVAYGLKALAKDLGVPVIVLAQLNRGVESRDDKRPHLSDLRDSGAIEEAADVIGLLYSESYYDPEFTMPYVLECRIDKHRNGERGELLWRFDGEHSRVSVLDPGARAQYLHHRAERSRPNRRSRSDEL
jgi:replicative DNA helicase